MGYRNEDRSINWIETATIIFMFFAFAYLLVPWDILPFSFFDDLAFVIIALSIWAIVTKQTVKRLRKTFLSGGLIMIVAFSGTFGAMYASNSWASVDTGHALLIIDYQTGNIQVVLGATAGFYLDGGKVMLGLVRTVDIYYSTDAFDAMIPCFSKDQLEMGVNITLRWQLNTSLIVQLYRNYPKLDYEPTAIDSIMEKVIRFVTRNFTAVETIANRPQIAEQMQNLIFENLRNEPSLAGALSYMTFDLKNIAYPPNYTNAIEVKLEAEQMQLKAEFERQRTLILANATAQQSIIEAYGQAQAKIINSEATQEAIQRLIQAAGANGTEAFEIAKLYINSETLKVIAPYIQNLIMIQGSALPVITIPTNSTTP
jgi:regulator of protease activity HflC (stomatin/prohibitin superfamily)